MKKILFTILLIFFFIPGVNALNIDYDSTTFDVRFTDLNCDVSLSNCFYINLGSWVGHKNIGSTISVPSGYNIPVFNTVSFRTYLKSSFIAGNTYTLKYYFETSENNVNSFKKYWKLWNVIGGDSYSNMSESSISNFSFTFSQSSKKNNGYYVTLMFTPQVSFKYLNSYFRDESYNQFGRNITDFIYNNSIKYVSLNISFSEGLNSSIDKNTIAVNNLIEVVQDKLFSFGKTIEDNTEVIKDDSIDDKSGFFTGFSEKSFGLTGVITMPLQAIQQLNNPSCDGFKTIVFNKEIEFPSGCIMWNNVPNSTLIIYYTFIIGFLSYILLVDLFKTIERLRNPDDQKGVDTLDL